MPVVISNIIAQFSNDLKKILGDNIIKVLVYGSYARGDYSELSDVDVMILVSLSEEQIHEKRDQVNELAFDYFMDYGIDISPLVKNISHFNEWSEASVFYRNVQKEGIVVA